MGNFNLAPTSTHLSLTSAHLHPPSIRLHLPPPAANHLKKVKA